MNYTKLCQEFSNYECNLLSTELEIQEQMKNRSITIYHVKVKIFAKCGHEHECVVTNFLQRRTAVMCKDCRVQSIKTVMKSKSNSFEIEFNGYKDIKAFLEKDFEVERTKEGCKADFMIRPKDCLDDQWIGVQLKVTQKMSFKMYTFRNVSKSYDDLLIFCYCLEEKKLWILPYFDIKDLKANLNISERSKYNKYLILSTTNILAQIESFKNKSKLYNKEELLTPISIQNQQEQTYAQIRERNLPFINFTYPDIENGKTDFYINQLKIQEKISSTLRNKDIIILCAHNKTIDGIRKWRSYQLGENDFYWIHLKNSSQFYIIPEIELFNRNYISSKETYINKVYITIDNNDWLSEYLFDYNCLDKDKIKVLLGI